MAASRIQKFMPIVTSQAGPKCTSSLIFFHGSGDTGEGIKQWMDNVAGGKFSLPQTRIIYPTAPVRPYTPNGGQPSNVWFDRVQIAHGAPEHESVTRICDQVAVLIDKEVEDGIPKKNIILGGYSMGGSLAMHLGYRFHREVAAVFAFSSFLNQESAVFDALKEKPGSVPPLIQGHGVKDPKVFYRWGKETYKTLEALGVKADFHSFPDLQHELCREELQLLQDWALAHLPRD